MATIHGFHAHVYFSQETKDQARALCEAARDKFGIRMGRMHQKPLSPHPVWSCQLAFSPEKFGEIIPWLSLYRDGLVIFIHPETGDDYLDHAKHAIWMGQMLPLDLSVFTKTYQDA